MAPADSLLYLKHMLENIERIRHWTNGLVVDDPAPLEKAIQAMIEAR